MIKNNLYFYWLLIRGNAPIGTLLVMWPCLWLIAIESYYLPHDIKYIIIFIIGSFLTRSAGCIINDYIDIEYDKKVERTYNRVLAQHLIPKKNALIFAVILFLLSASLLFFLNYKCIYIAVFAVIMTIIYPYSKRFTNYPQIFLGVTFNLGILMADIAVRNKVTITGILIYVSAICWTIGYDTIYAYQDWVDDKKNDIKSTAVTYGNAGKWWITSFYKASFILFLCAFTIRKKIYFINMLFLLMAAYVLFTQIKGLDLHNPKTCKKSFYLNSWYGLCIFIASAVDFE